MRTRILRKQKISQAFLLAGLILIAAGLAGCAQQRTNTLDDRLRLALLQRNITPLDFGPPQDPDLVALGRSLFFDKELSGNRDMACSTCHEAVTHTADGQPLSVGTGGSGTAPNRVLGTGHEFVPRNAPDLFNRGSPLFTVMFWDSRVNGSTETGFDTPADDDLPYGLDSLLAVQAMFPVTSREEMRGFPGDVDIFGNRNELAMIDDEDRPAIWAAVMARLLAYPGYVDLFAAAYPDVPVDQLGFEHAARANAAFMIDAFTLADSPWDMYLAGDNAALSDQAKRGALLFYGRANCGACHAGSLMSDQLPHNMGVPQFGPGKGDGVDSNLDFGRAGETYMDADLWAFRTPPLRNVALTGPWMHNGAFTTLEAAVRHMLDPAASLRSYDPSQLSPELAETVKPEMVEEILASLDPLGYPRVLTDSEFEDLLAFLHALTSPAALDLEHVIPESLPSGLLVGN